MFQLHHVMSYHTSYVDVYTFHTPYIIYRKSCCRYHSYHIISHVFTCFNSVGIWRMSSCRIPRSCLAHDVNVHLGQGVSKAGPEAARFGHGDCGKSPAK